MDDHRSAVATLTVLHVFLSEIVDGNVKMTLGMIWTIILRFAIQDISVEGERRAPALPQQPNRRCFFWVTVVCLLRNLGQGGAPSVVPEEDRPLQERQRSELPRQVIGLIKLSLTYPLIYLPPAQSSPQLSSPYSCQRGINISTYPHINLISCATAEIFGAYLQCWKGASAAPSSWFAGTDVLFFLLVILLKLEGWPGLLRPDSQTQTRPPRLL